MKKARTDVTQQPPQQQPWGTQQPSSAMSSMPSQTQSPFANPTSHWYSPTHSFQQQHMPRRNEPMDYRYQQPPAQSHHPTPVQPPMNVGQHAAQSHPQHAPAQPAPQPPQQQQPQPAPAPAPTPQGRKRQRQQPAAAPPSAPGPVAQPPVPPAPAAAAPPVAAPAPVPAPPTSAVPPAQPVPNDDASATPTQPPTKKSRTNTPWTPAEELRLKQMRDAGNSWAEIAKTFPTRTEGSVKKHWYKDMHYAEFAEDESQALLSAIKEYENNKWKVIGQKVGKPAKACEQYAKEHFAEHFQSGTSKR